MRFHTWVQNNSGGQFIEPAHFVCIEAENVDAARTVAEGLGLYFDGAGDCPTCGDRWHRDPNEIAESPTCWDMPLHEAARGRLDPSWLIVYADGRREQNRLARDARRA